jgi:ubiquitin C-terminal hydrolase
MTPEDCKSNTRKHLLSEVRRQFPYMTSLNLYKKDELCDMVRKKCDVLGGIQNKNNSCYFDSLLVALMHSDPSKQSKFIRMLRQSPMMYEGNPILAPLAKQIINEFEALAEQINTPSRMAAVTCSPLRILIRKYDKAYTKNVEPGIERVNWTSAQLEPADVLRFLNRVVNIPDNVVYRMQSFGTNSNRANVSSKALTIVTDNKVRTNFASLQVNTDVIYGTTSVDIGKLFPRSKTDVRFGDDVWLPSKNISFKRRIEKVMYLSGDMLFIHVNRIIMGDKLQTRLDVPMKLKLRENIHSLYLRSIIVHHGGVDGGHYTTFLECKGTWYHFDGMSPNTLHEIGDYGKLILYRGGYVFMNVTDMFYA